MFLLCVHLLHFPVFLPVAPSISWNYLNCTELRMKAQTCTVGFNKKSYLTKMSYSPSFSSWQSLWPQLSHAHGSMKVMLLAWVRQESSETIIISKEWHHRQWHMGIFLLAVAPVVAKHFTSLWSGLSMRCWNNLYMGGYRLGKIAATITWAVIISFSQLRQQTN